MWVIAKMDFEASEPGAITDELEFRAEIIRDLKNSCSNPGIVNEVLAENLCYWYCPAQCGA